MTKQKGHAGQSVGKGSRTAWPHLQYVDRDVDGLTFSPKGLLVDVLVRTGAGTAFLLEPVYGACYRSMHNRKMLHQFVEEDGAGVPRDLEKLLFADTVFAFAGSRALPDLKEAVRRTCLRCFGQTGRPGISLGAVWRWLEQNLPAPERARLAVPDWEATAERISVAAMAFADPVFAADYEKLRVLTGRYPDEPDYELLFDSADTRTRRLSSFVPRGQLERVHFFNAEMETCMDLLERCVAGRQAFADRLHGEVEREAMQILRPARPLFDEAFASGTRWIREFLAWFMPEGDADIDGMMAEFERRFHASGKRFDVFQTCSNCVSLMLADWEALEWPHTDFFRLRVKNARKRLDALRPVPEGLW